MNAETYENLSDSVLAWKRNQKLGRFDPNALSPEDSLRKQVEKDKAEIARRGKQCNNAPNLMHPPYFPFPISSNL